MSNFDSMTCSCLICNVGLDSTRKLEIHLQTEHKWGEKREPRGLDT